MSFYRGKLWTYCHAAQSFHWQTTVELERCYWLLRLNIPPFVAAVSEQFSSKQYWINCMDLSFINPLCCWLLWDCSWTEKIDFSCCIYDDALFLFLIAQLCEISMLCMQIAILSIRPSVYLSNVSKECTYRHTFWPCRKGITLVFWAHHRYK